MRKYLLSFVVGLDIKIVCDLLICGQTSAVSGRNLCGYRTI